MTPKTETREKPKGALAFFQHEAAAGIVLVAATVAALVFDNTPLTRLYQVFLDTPVGVRVGALAIDKPLLLWINDGLMAIFFFLVGLEIKRELLRGRAVDLRPGGAAGDGAIGGMAVPALIYVCDQRRRRRRAARAGPSRRPPTSPSPSACWRCWGRGCRASLKLFLLALAILDDLGAIVIIALFYTENLSLALAGAWRRPASSCSRPSTVRGVTRLAPYLLAGLFIWVCVLKSGVHATLAGVVVAFAIPLTRARAPTSPRCSSSWSTSLHPWVAFGVLPLFAFANAGVSLAGLSLAKLAEPVPLGIAVGLFLGKPLGILGATWLAVVSGLAPQPAGANWGQLAGVGMLGGIGFTMSLFIGTLAFYDGAYAADVRMGVLTGSLLSAMAGLAVLTATSPRTAAPPG